MYQFDQKKTARSIALLLVTSCVLLCVSKANAQNIPSGWVPAGLKEITYTESPSPIIVDTPSPEELEATRLTNVARSLVERGEYDKALPILLASDKIWHDSVFGATPLLARVYSELGRDSEAVSQFQKRFITETNDGVARWVGFGDAVDCFRYATALARTGNANLAVEIYNMGLRLQLENDQKPVINPVVFDDSPHAKRYTAKRMEAAARLQIARETIGGYNEVGKVEIDRVLAIEPDNAVAHLYRGLLYAGSSATTTEAVKQKRAVADAEYKKAEALGRVAVKQAVASARKLHGM